MRRSLKLSLVPNKIQAENLDRIRLGCQELYNAALQEKRDAWKKQGIGRSFNDQSSELPALKIERPDIGLVYGQVLQDVLKRLHKGFDAFFRRVKAGEKPGYPRFKSRDRYDSFTFPQAGDSRYRGALRSRGVDLLPSGKIRVHGVPGEVRVRWHRTLSGKVKTATFKKEGYRWFLILSYDEVPENRLPSTGKVCGIDLGLNKLAVLDDGTVYANPRHLRHAEGKLNRAQRILSRRKKGGYRRKQARKVVARQHRRVSAARQDHLHKVTREIVNHHDLIAVENLSVQGLARGMLAKSFHDASWGYFLSMLTYKAEEAGREIVKVDPRGTSQMCSGCDREVRKDLSVRVHECPHCGLKMDRDQNAARNILKRAGSALRGEHQDAGLMDPRSQVTDASLKGGSRTCRTCIPPWSYPFAPVHNRGRS